MLVDKLTFINQNASTSMQASNMDGYETMSQPGALGTITGTSRWYPHVEVKLVNVQAIVGVASVGADIHIDIKKNGVSILSSPLTIPAGQNVSNVVDISSNQLTTSDYLTVDVNQIGSTTAGSDLSVRFMHRTI